MENTGGGGSDAEGRAETRTPTGPRWFRRGHAPTRAELHVTNRSARHSKWSTVEAHGDARAQCDTGAEPLSSHRTQMFSERSQLVV